MLTKEEAILKVEPKQLDTLLHPAFASDGLKEAKIVAKGLPASPGAACGKIAVRVFLPLIPLRDLLPGDYARPELHMIATARRCDGRCLLLELERAGIRLIGYNPFTLCRFR